MTVGLEDKLRWALTLAVNYKAMLEAHQENSDTYLDDEDLELVREWDADLRGMVEEFQSFNEGPTGLVGDPQ